MYLLYAPNSYIAGNKEPRAYVDVDHLKNYSTYNDNGSESDDFIKTMFYKVRIIVMRNKNKVYVDKFDTTDFKYAYSLNK